MKGGWVFAASPYGNSAPLVDRLAEADARVRVVHGHPAGLADDLAAGRADVALVPVVHLFSHPELSMLGRLGVAADGPVQSVLLKCRVPVGQVGTVARDPASATSNRLAELLLERRFGRRVRMVDAAAAERSDAAVAIGDRALLAPPSRADDIDLAGAWQAMTGLPFVFAAWAVRADFPERDVAEGIVRKSYALGMRSIDGIAARLAARHGRGQAFWRGYLGGSVHYELGGRDLEGLELFRSLVSAH